MSGRESMPHGTTQVRITADPARFEPLLGGGFLLSGAAGGRLEEFLQREAGIEAEYLRDRVQTLFLDGRPVDDPAAAVVADGAVVSLSAAMPGLAGAVLRRSGRYAAMRRPISHDAGRAADAAPTPVAVTLKLFNLIARELGPQFLAHGIRIDGEALRDFLERQGRWLWREGDAAAVDGRELAPAELARALPVPGEVRLRVTPR